MRPAFATLLLAALAAGAVAPARAQLPLLPSGSAAQAEAAAEPAPSPEAVAPEPPAEPPRWLSDLVPGPALEAELLRLQSWQWAGLLLAIVVALLAAWAMERVLNRFGRALTRRTETRYDDALLAAAANPARLGIALLLYHLFARSLQLPHGVAELLAALEGFVAIVAVGWLFLNLVDVFALAARSALVERGESGAMAVVPLGTRVAKALVLAFAVLAVLGDAGVDVKKLWASLGIGAIAVALAAQKTLEDVFGGLTLIVSQPVRVGDTCRFGAVTGRVEDIGLRQTRIRTPDRGLLSVPNAQFASAQVENLSRRQSTRFFARLVLATDTPSERVAAALEALRGVLAGHALLEPDGAHVRLVGASPAGLEIELLAHVRTTEGEEHLAVQEELLLRALAAVERCGARLATLPPR